jgi:hypothetical protein
VPLILGESNVRYMDSFKKTEEFSVTYFAAMPSNVPTVVVIDPCVR